MGIRPERHGARRTDQRGRRLITFFTIPKSFDGRSDRVQRNAIGSWARVVPGAEVILFGDDAGVAEAAGTLGAEHVSSIERTELGTPLLDGAFAEARARASHDLLCFLNADIVLLPDFHAAAARVADLGPPLLMIGETWDVPLDTLLNFEHDSQAHVAALVSQGRRRGAGALDYFLFTRDLFDELPPFAVGRVGFDNWLIWRARANGAQVVDATPTVRAAHQQHDYSHVMGGRAATRLGSAEASRNLELAASKSRLYTRYDATHVLGRRRLRRNLLSVFRLKENLRKVVYKTRMHTPWLPHDAVRGPQ